MCNKAIVQDPWSLLHVPDYLKTQEMCERAAEKDPYTLKHVPDDLKMKEMCEDAVDAYPWALEFVPMELITQEMCNEAVKICTWSLVYVPDHCLKLQAMWHEDYLNAVIIKTWHYDDKIIEWRNGYEQRKALKAKILEELLRVGCHPSKWWDWCIPEDDKTDRKVVE